MKTNTTVITLIETAKKRAAKTESGIGIAIKNKRQQFHSWGGGVTQGELQENYRVEYVKDGMGGDSVELYHYETMTAQVWLADQPQVLYVYGESRSDADSVNTFLDFFGLPATWTYRPVNGGFMEVK